MDIRLAAIVAVAAVIGTPGFAAAKPSRASLEAKVLSDKFIKVIRDADVERLGREHRVCELHRIYATSAYTWDRYQKANVVVLMKLNTNWYPFSESRTEVTLAESARAMALELTRRLRSGIYFPSRCEYKEIMSESEFFLQHIQVGSNGDIAQTLRYHLAQAKIPDNKDANIASKGEIRKAIEQHAAAIAPSLKKRWRDEAKGGWCDAAGVLWYYLTEEAIEPAKLGLSEAEARQLEEVAPRLR
ncbi:hypothetical protein HYV71_02755 [Candidatus Uhrbacteria bacterium]|nr:hypothetical protein [Candidatus Uhrbacteria bacterium]